MSARRAPNARRLAALPVALAIAAAPMARAQSGDARRDTTPPPVNADTGDVGRIVGFVTDTDGRPVAGALVTVVGTRVTVRSDGRGHFMFVQVPPGLTVLVVRRLGYQFKYLDVDVPPGDPIEASVVMARSAQLLDTMTVTAARSTYDKPARLDHTTRYDDFYARRRMGFGRSYTREQIDSMHVSGAMEAVERVPFLRVAHSQGSVSINSGGARCPSVAVFIDGHYSRENADVLDMMSADEIEAIELYRGIAGKPLEAEHFPCALMVWTR